MNTMGISTDPSLLDVELPRSLIESPSVSTFLPEEEASICPLLSMANGNTPSPLTFSHPLNPCVDDDCGNTANHCNDDNKADASSSGSSSGIGMDVPDSTTATLFNKHLYQHLQHNGKNGNIQDGNNHSHNGNGNLNALSKDTTPPFVSWNWPLIRKCTFFLFMSSLFAMCAIVVAMIATLPKTCNPETAWYRGSVFYEIFPASFQDSNNDGLGDLRGIGNRVDYLASMGIMAVRLNSIFPSPHYPEDFENVTSLMEISSVLGSSSDVRQLADTLHARNISLILDLPLNNVIKELTEVTATPLAPSLELNDSTPTTTTNLPPRALDESLVVGAMRKWLEMGVDGFYIKGLEQYLNNIELLSSNMAEWQRFLGSNRVLIVSETVLNGLSEPQQNSLLPNIDLVDVHLDVLNGTRQIAKRIDSVLNGPFSPIMNGAWIHWSIGGVEKKRITGQLENSNVTLAATIMQLMLPGTPNIFYGDEIALESAYDPQNEHGDTRHLHHLATMHWSNSPQQFTGRETLPWLPQTASYTFENLQRISQMIELRDKSPSIYKNAICKADHVKKNTQIRLTKGDEVLIVERVYPRRNSFVAISNFASKPISRDLTKFYYSGQEMLIKGHNDTIFFSDFHIESLQTIVFKLNK